MHSSFFKFIVFLCLLVLLNACGIGRYHNLNLVRPDKKTTVAIVKAKHKKGNDAKEIHQVDSLLVEANSDKTNLEIAHKFSNKTNITPIAFFNKKLSKKIKIELKEKLSHRFLKNTTNDNSNKKQTKWKPIFNPAGDLGAFGPLILLFAILAVVGYYMAPYNPDLGILLLFIGGGLAVIFLILAALLA